MDNYVWSISQLAFTASISTISLRLRTTKSTTFNCTNLYTMLSLLSDKFNYDAYPRPPVTVKIVFVCKHRDRMKQQQNANPSSLQGEKQTLREKEKKRINSKLLLCVAHWHIVSKYANRLAVEVVLNTIFFQSSFWAVFFFVDRIFFCFLWITSFLKSNKFKHKMTKCIIICWGFFKPVKRNARLNEIYIKIKQHAKTIQFVMKEKNVFITFSTPFSLSELLIDNFRRFFFGEMCWICWLNDLNFGRRTYNFDFFEILAKKFFLSNFRKKIFFKF